MRQLPQLLRQSCPAGATFSEPCLRKSVGAFDFKYAYSSGDPRQEVISVILASLQGLGLRLEAAQGPTETLVIDSAEKPSEN
jgi:uncharacterized protein (TIGR03435 family)